MRPGFNVTTAFRRAGRPALLAALALGLGGCAEVATMAAVNAANAVAYDGSGQTLGDRLMSWTTDRDCNMEAFRAGQPWCRPKATAVEETPVCYRSIGRVTCYTEPNPNETASRRMPE
ncbi:MAG: hypothetical protein AB7N54_06965 [Alphaproteobacteria bacterium]